MGSFYGIDGPWFGSWKNFEDLTWRIRGRVSSEGTGMVESTQEVEKEFISGRENALC